MQMIGDPDKKSPPDGIAPHITCAGAEEAIAFYTEAFGAQEVFRSMHDDGVRIMYAHLRMNGGSFMLHDDFPEYRGEGEMLKPQGVILHLQVDDVEIWWQRAISAGAEVVAPLEDQMWGDRYGHLKDKWGHTWSLASPSKKET